MVDENTFKNRPVVITDSRKAEQIIRYLLLLKMVSDLNKKEIIEEFFKASPDYIFLHGKWQYKSCFMPKPLMVVQA